MEDGSVLLTKAHAGDKEARKVLIEENLGLVRHVAKRFDGRGLSQEELVQIGVIGLIQAIDRFDTSMGGKLSTYAVPLIMGEIRQYFRSASAVKVPRGIQENARLLRAAREHLREKMMREPSFAELADEAGLSYEDAVLAMEAEAFPESLDAERDLGDGNAAALGERIGADSAAGSFMACTNPRGDAEKDRILDRMLLRELWEGLSKEERRLLWLRYFREKTQTQAAKELGISQVQVSRKEKKILEKMKEGL